MMREPKHSSKEPRFRFQTSFRHSKRAKSVYRFSKISNQTVKMSSASSSASTYRVPAIVAWDDFIEAVRSNGGRGFVCGAPAPTCGVVECTGPCPATIASRPTVNTPATPAPATPAPATPTPVPAPITTTVTADTIPRIAPERMLYEFVTEKFCGRRTPVRWTDPCYEEYKRWEARQPADYIRSTTPYARITQYITVERANWLEWESNTDYIKILLLGKLFPGRSLMEMKDIIFPMYLEWRKTAILLRKMNRWQKMKQFATEYATMF